MGKNKSIKDGIEVIRSIYYGNIKMLKDALEDNINIDATNEFGETALMYACNSKNEELVKMIVDYGANVNLQNKMGNTPIIYACDSGNKSIVEYLLEHGADVNHKSCSGRTALICACGSRDVILVKYLLEHGAEVNCESRDGETPLIRACDKCSFEVVKCLVEHGADVNAQNIMFETALMRTIRHGVADENLEIVVYLVDNGADLDVMNTSIELRDFMKRIMTKEPKIGTIIAMRKEGLKGVRRFLEKFVKSIRTECMLFLAHSNTARKLKEDNDALERQLKKELMDNIKFMNPKKEVENIVRNHLLYCKRNEQNGDDSIGSSSDVLNNNGYAKIDINDEQKDSAHIVENDVLSIKRSAHVKKHNSVVTKNEKLPKKQNRRGKKHDIHNKNGDGKDKGKISLVDIMNEKNLETFTPNISIVSRMQAWERNGRDKGPRSK